MTRTQIRSWLLVGGAGAAPPLSFFAPLGLAPLLVLLGAAILAVGDRRKTLASIPRVPALLSLAFLVWGLASALWAIEPLVSVHKFGQLIVLFAAGWIVVAEFAAAPGGDRAPIKVALSWGVIATLGLFAVEILFGAPISRLIAGDNGLELGWMMARHNRSATFVAILLGPAALAIGRRYGAVAGVALGTVGVVVLWHMHSRTAMVGGAIALCVAALALNWRRLIHIVVGAVIAAGIFLPTFSPYLIPTDEAEVKVMREEAIRRNVFSFFHRLRIWEFVVERIDERPVLGWGLDSSRSLPGGKEQSDAAGERLSLHPHNAALQVRVELGVPGIVLAAAFILWPLVTLRRSCAEGVPEVLSVAVAAMIVASMSYGIWQSWWVAALWLSAALASLACSPSPGDSP